MISRRFLKALLLACGIPALACAQTNVLTVDPPSKVTVKRNAPAEAKLSVHVQAGYHANSNQPNEDYLIPLRLKWEPGALEAAGTAFPKPELRNYAFSEKPVSVFTGDFAITQQFKVAAGAPGGQGILVGKLRYQACTENSCLPPRTVEVRLPYTVQ